MEIGVSYLIFVRIVKKKRGGFEKSSWDPKLKWNELLKSSITSKYLVLSNKLILKGQALP